VSSARRRNQQNEPRIIRAALITAVCLGVFTVGVFTKSNPFSSPFELRGVFSSATQLKKGSAVRIAGIDVGKVTQVESGPGNTAVVTMGIERDADRLHRDSTFTIQPRLFFEGNFYVDISPGSPAQPKLKSGDTVPRSQTAVPVQLDQVLSTFTAPNRGALRRMIGSFGSGFGTGNKLGAPPRDGVTPGSAGLRRAARELDAALAPATVVARAFQGTQAGDLRRSVTYSGDTAEQFAQSPAALADFVTNFNRTFAALAADDRALAASVRGLDNVLVVAPRALTSIDHALPSLTSFATALRPTLAQAPLTLRKTNRLLAEIEGLMGAGELPPLVRSLRPVTATLPVLEARLKALFPYVSETMGCIARNVVPTLNKQAPDGALSTGYPIWLDLIHTATALAGTSPAFDGNGTTIRLGVTSGEGQLHGFLPGIGQVQATQQVSGVRPTWLGLGVTPPYRPDQPCTQQALPDLSQRSGGPPAGFTPQATSRSKAGLARDLRVRQLVADALAGRLGKPAPQQAVQQSAPIPTQRAGAPAAAVAPSAVPPATSRPQSQAPGIPQIPVQQVAADLGTGLANALKSLVGGAR
jgi:ABC-type transporter Mla subunit MlaD